MAFSGFGDDTRPQPMVEINTTPLVDVMLVLLIIFMITAPLLTHKIQIDLPQASTQQNPEKPEIITLSIDADDAMFWNDSPIGDAEFSERLNSAAQRQPQPELHLRADKNTRYQRLAGIMAEAQNAGVKRIGFVTEPERK